MTALFSPHAVEEGCQGDLTFMVQDAVEATGREGACGGRRGLNVNTHAPYARLRK